jgi:hypothetical protein
LELANTNGWSTIFGWASMIRRSMGGTWSLRWQCLGVAFLTLFGDHVLVAHGRHLGQPLSGLCGAQTARDLTVYGLI